MYSIDGIVSDYEKKLDAINEAIDDVQNRIYELKQAESELEECKTQIESALDALNNLDEISVEVSVDGFDFDLSAT